MEITVVGRHAEISSRFRAYAEEKVSKVTQYDPRAQRAEIEVSHQGPGYPRRGQLQRPLRSF